MSQPMLRSMVQRHGVIASLRTPGGRWAGWTPMPSRAPRSMAVVR
ncbi:hypothetical protein [Streptomyces formicae]|nr:hypothetical protein [Streptomyces formicae]